MSRQLAALSVVLTRVGRPWLARAPTPKTAARDFAIVARLAFRVPPGLCMIPDRGAPVRMWRITCGPVAARRIILYLHGGAYFAGSAATHRGVMGRLSRLAGVEVAAPDYRLLQDAPFPAAYDDALAAWDHLRDRGYAPGEIVIAGDSAGGGLALAVLAEVLGRGERPAGVVVFSPWTDLTLSGATLDSADEVILPVERMAEVAGEYLRGAAAADVRASPLFAAFPEPPPVMIQVGGREALRDDSERMAARLRAGGGVVDLRVWEECPHVWHIFDGWIPEARAALKEAAAFVQTSLASASR